MKYLTLLTFTLCIFVSNSSVSSSIYKCGNGYSDTPCSNDPADIIHIETREEKINRIIRYGRNGNFNKAKRYAEENNLANEYNAMIIRYKKVLKVKELVGNERFSEARKYAEQNKLTYEYNFFINKYQAVLKQQQRQQIAQQQRRQSLLNDSYRDISDIMGDRSSYDSDVSENKSYFQNGSFMHGSDGSTMFRNGPFTVGPNETFMDNGAFMNGSNGTTCFRNGPFVNCN